MKPLIRFAALSLVLLPLAGCRDVPPPTQVREDPYLPDQIQIADTGLRRRIAVQQPRLTRDEAGLVYITVPVRNTTSAPLALEYRTTFYDINHQPLPGSPTTWFPKNLPANVFDQITVNSTSPRVADFQVEFRYGR